ncbi:MAG TPA: ABC transporter substrate-binding protein [Nitrospirota bacterium]|nr:ABC transporter substrate-binding protein [Nitrospirota bacterium]
MRRVVWLLLGAWCLNAAYAHAAEKSIGVIMPGNIGYYQDAHKAFVATLAKEGFDYHTVDTLMQMPSPDPMSWINAARKLNAVEVNVVLAYSAPLALAAVREARAVPLVFSAVYDPAADGVSGKNITGISSFVPMANLLKYLKKLVPFAQLAFVYDVNDPDSLQQSRELSRLETKFGFQTVRMPVHKFGEARKLNFAGKADVVLISVGDVVNEEIDDIVKRAHKANIPTASMLGGASDHGVVLTLAPSAAEQGETAARMTARILRGEKPSAIPVMTPQIIELILNMKEAEGMGIRASADLIRDATKVIK